ncbi:DUF1801 domain-containing protein [Photobacterium angustum]|uniref:DUF1801 domain-containing protein n=1 Tax=Photobacterium angustum TaxID=661 RepID=A0A2T3LSX1_PHOAN|nr:DUF1801 domain-containing protein [Photobacterium angustum]KJF83489.1 hypothetical protein UB36_02820 [Photobacterium damselae subsp. damselae]KJF92796.1 hypothetical protein UB39_18550 [Photobacterium angustum]KJG02328.1 hypothetical protein UB35_09470 [Photobacterium angustum]KJG04595.1 hypothetical protein UB33_18010 [Photobacterium angustum]KJG17387.1 hypothetical protein UA33_08765 [Photobacterium angustum]
MDLSVKQKFETYPDEVTESLLVIRSLIINTANEHGIADLIETLKWGEPSYISKIGSTIRYDWKPKFPNEYRIYFHCQTTLVDTFKEVYGNTFEYEGNRALIFKLSDDIPTKELSHCISMALRYKKLKHLDLLGA